MHKAKQTRASSPHIDEGMRLVLNWFPFVFSLKSCWKCTKEYSGTSHNGLSEIRTLLNAHLVPIVNPIP